jgi:hypothetical protein
LPITITAVSRVGIDIVVPATELVESSATRALHPQWRRLLENAISDSERALLPVLAERGVDLPEQGFESAAGMPIDLSWPDRRIAVDIDLDANDRADLEGEHWVVVPPDVDAIIAALGSREGVG